MGGGYAWTVHFTLVKAHVKNQVENLVIEPGISGGRGTDTKPGISGRRGPQTAGEMHWVPLKIQGTWDLEPGGIL